MIAGGIINDVGHQCAHRQGRVDGGRGRQSPTAPSSKLPTQIGVVTNIDPEHMDYWETVEAMHRGFQHFIEAIPFYGLAVACIDHPVVRELLASLAALPMAGAR